MPIYYFEFGNPSHIVYVEEENLENDGQNPSNNNNTPLHSSVRHSEIITELLLKAGASVNAANNDGKTSLHNAVEFNATLSITKLLLQHGANVNVQDNHGLTPLHIAAERAWLEQVDLLLMHGANVNPVITSTWKKNCTPLHLAVEAGSPQVTDFLLSRGANVDIRAKIGRFSSSDSEVDNAVDNDPSKYGKTVLELAVEQEDVMIVKIILSYSPDVQNTSNLKALKDAVNGRYTDIVNDLVKYGFTLGPEEVHNSKLLYNAVDEGYVKIVKNLLKHGAAVNIVNHDSHALPVKKGFTLLHKAVENKNQKMVKLLLSYGANVKAVDEDRNIPLYYAIENDDLNTTKLLTTDRSTAKSIKLLCSAVVAARKDIIEIILQSGINVNNFDEFGKRPLHYLPNRFIFWNDNIQIAKLLINNGARVNAQTKRGMTTLHFAAKSGYQNVVEGLLTYNINVNCISNSKITPLHFAATNENVGVTKLLLNRGANVNATLKDGTTALHIATRLGTADIVDELLMAGAEVNAKIRRAADTFYVDYGDDCQIINCAKVELQTPLHIAAQGGCQRIIQNLLTFGADVNAIDKHCKTALHLAVQTGSVDIVQILIRYGADLDIRDDSGSTPIFYAAMDGRIEIVKTLLVQGADINIVNKMYNTPLDFALNERDDNINDSLEINNDSRDRAIRVRKFFILHLLSVHVIKIKVANFYVCDRNVRLVYLLYPQINLSSRCEEEIKKLKNKKLTSHISLYNILKGNISQLSLFAKNQKVLAVLRSNDYKKEFPLYASIIHNNYRKGVKRSALLENHSELYDILRDNVYDLPYECYDHIFSYLKNQDFQLLLRACGFVTFN